MRDFHCPVCGNRLVFDNSRCLRCGSDLGYDLGSRSFLVVGDGGRRCANQGIAGCNWLVPDGSNSALCTSCALTRTRPSDDDVVGLPEFAAAEAAKRRLVVELAELHLPIVDRRADPAAGLCFDLLSSVQTAVTTGHEDGVITLDLAESNDAHREALRASMDEPYRTLLGHFRHEIGHYYYPILTADPDDRLAVEKLFGDAEQSYSDALERHYTEGPPPGWQASYISAYATMHPAEDWAETFAHYLHIRDTIDTASAVGFAPRDVALDQGTSGAIDFDELITIWLPLVWALNLLNRSMGQGDLYPFVVPTAVLEKMMLVHRLIAAGGRTP